MRGMERTVRRAGMRRMQPLAGVRPLTGSWAWPPGRRGRACSSAVDW